MDRLAPGIAATGSQDVLVVDDNPATRYATSRVLQAAGFGVRTAGTGSEALALAAGAAAVVLDVHLPDFDGYEVCRQLRLRPDTARLPVIHLSAAYIRDNDKVRGLHSGADAYMTHPAEPALLVATVQALVRARTAEEGMRRSEARFRAIFDHALSGICLIDEEGRFMEVNPAMLAMLQRDPAEVVGRPVAEFVAPEWAEHVAHTLARHHEGVWRGDFPLRNARGEPVHTEWSLSTHVEPGISMAVVSDISERVTLAQQREQLIEREQAARSAAERVSRSKDEFIAVLSHELRTPLNAILGWVHVLKRPQAQGELPRGLDAIERNARTQTRLISDLLDVSRMDLGKLRLELEQVDAVEVVGMAVATLAGPAADKGLTLHFENGASAQPVRVDPARLQQIVWNLLTNAIKFSEPGGRIDVVLHDDDSPEAEGGLVLEVADQGQGIRPDFLPYLFDRFSQSDSASNRYHGGLGLGLSIVKHLVELHGGSIRVHSAGTGQGTRFVVRLPRRPPAAVQLAPREDAPPPAPASHADLSGLEVLVVEDDAEAREMLTLVLRERDAQVRVARDHAEGLAALAERRPDVLVSDVGLPGKDGYEFIRDLRCEEAAGDRDRLPAIALTAFARPKDRELALAAGFDAHCAKPLQPHELIATILRLVAR